MPLLLALSSERCVFAALHIPAARVPVRIDEIPVAMHDKEMRKNAGSRCNIHRLDPAAAVAVGFVLVARERQLERTNTLVASKTATEPVPTIFALCHL